MDEILRTVGTLLKRSESQQKKIRRILHYPTNFVTRTWVKLPSLRTRKVKVTYVLFYVVLALVLFYILSVRSRLGSSRVVKKNAKLFLSKNFNDNTKNLDRRVFQSQIISNQVVVNEKSSSVEERDRKPYEEGKNIGYEIKNSVREFHLKDSSKKSENGKALAPEIFDNGADISHGRNSDVHRPNPQGNDEPRRQNIARLRSNEGRVNRNQDVDLPVVAEYQNKSIGSSVLNPHLYRLLLNNARICSKGSQVSLFIAVLSSTRHFEQRDAVRRTWGSGLSLAPLRAKMAFFLASPPRHEAHLQSQIRIEAQTYGDVIQEDFADTYRNLTLKSVMALKWVQEYCPQAEYFLKTDDDIFVNVPKLLAFLHEQSQLRDRFIVGCIKQHKSFAPVNLPVSFSMPPAHPLFVAGAGYAMTGGLVPLLYQASLHTPIIPVEDVYVTGHLAGAVGVHPPLHHPLFTCGELLLDDCDAMQVFTGHRITPRRMVEIWNKVNPVEYSDSPCFDF